MIPLVDLQLQYRSIKPELDAAILRVLENAQFILGPAVSAFEADFAAFCGAAEAVGVSSGTSALHLALVAAGVGPSDEVITVPFTFVATVAAIEYAGAKPVFVDVEPGYWTIQPSEAKRLREYLLKGGFIIFDDFEGPDHWNNMAAQMRQALPEYQFLPIDERHPIFHSFYDILALKVPHPSMDVVPGYFAMFENNDPSRRMIALANHNNDIAEYWEWSAEGLYNPDPTSDAYRLGVNYYVYALTH